MITREQLIITSFFIFSLLLTLGLYWQGLHGVFLVDDTVNLAALNKNGGVTTWNAFQQFVFGNTSGALGRPVSMLSFLINDQYYPGDVSSYRYTNLMLHCLVGVALFVFVRILLSALQWPYRLSVQMALLTMIWWLLLPINVSTTLYVVQRMTQLASLFTLLGLICYLKGRDILDVKFPKGLAWIAAGFGVFGLLALLSKESGALIFVYALACEMAIGFGRGKRPGKVLISMICAPILAMIVYFIVEWDRSINFYDYRIFTLGERLLTESRIVAGYLVQGVLSLTSKMGLMQDDIVLSVSLFSPLTTIISLVFHIGMLIIGWLVRRRQPLVLFGLLWFYGGHLLESTFIPLELYFEHRNYMPLMGVLLAAVALLWHCFSLKWFGRLLLVGLVVHAGMMTYMRASLWGKPDELYKTWAFEHPQSLRAQTVLAKMYIKDGMFDVARQQLYAMRTHWPEAAHIDITLLVEQCYKHLANVVTIPEVLISIDNARYSSQLDTAVENLVEAQEKGVCPELLNGNIHKILTALDRVKGTNNKFLAKIAFWQGKLYIRERNLNGAIESLDRSYRYHKDGVPLYVSANLLASAGLYEEALQYIDRAIKFEQARYFQNEKNLAAYREIKRRIQESLKIDI